jgi:hypothetical protein
MGFRGLIPARATIFMAANALIEKGNIACLDATGHVLEGTDVAHGAVTAAGRSLARVDNSNGAAGAKSAQVELGIFEWINSTKDPVTAADVWKPVFVEGEATVARTSSGGALCEAGIMTELTGAGKVAVYMSPHIAALAHAVAAADASVQKRSVTLTGTSFSAAANTQVFNIGAPLPANARILGCEISGIGIAGAGITDAQVDVGGTNPRAIIDTADVFTGAVLPRGVPFGGNPHGKLGGQQLVATLHAVGANVSAINAGSLTIEVFFCVLA